MARASTTSVVAYLPPSTPRDTWLTQIAMLLRATFARSGFALPLDLRVLEARSSGCLRRGGASAGA